MRAAALIDNAMAGLQAAQAGILVTSQNVAGASVEGYVRRTAQPRITALAANSMELTGTAFAVEGFTRQFNQLLQGQLLSQQAKTAYTDALTQSVGVLDALLVEPASSIAAAMSAFFNAAGSLANEPSNPAYQQAVIGSARQVADRIRGLAGEVDRIEDNARQALADALNQANVLAPQLAAVNAKIRGAQNPGHWYPSADLLDERDRLTQQLQSLVGGSTIINEDGTASVLIAGQHLVDREKHHLFTNLSGTTPVRDDQDLVDLRLKVSTSPGQPTMLIPLVQEPTQQKNADGSPREDINGNSLMMPGVSAFQDGQAGAYVHLLNSFAPSMQKSLSLLGVSLVRQVNGIKNAAGQTIAPIFGFESTVAGGSDLSSATDARVSALFDDPASAQDYSFEALFEGSNPQSANYRKGIDQKLSAPDFDARLFKVVGTFDTTQFTQVDATASRAMEGLRDDFSSPVTVIITSVATTIAAWRSDHVANEAIQKSLSDQKEAASGVSLDEEAANLVKYQQLYNASSKLIQSGQQMFDTLLAMLSGR